MYKIVQMMSNESCLKGTAQSFSPRIDSPKLAQSEANSLLLCLSHILFPSISIHPAIPRLCYPLCRVLAGQLHPFGTGACPGSLSTPPCQGAGQRRRDDRNGLCLPWGRVDQAGHLRNQLLRKRQWQWQPGQPVPRTKHWAMRWSSMMHKKWRINLVAQLAPKLL